MLDLDAILTPLAVKRSNHHRRHHHGIATSAIAVGEGPRHQWARYPRLSPSRRRHHPKSGTSAGVPGLHHGKVSIVAPTAIQANSGPQGYRAGTQVVSRSNPARPANGHGTAHGYEGMGGGHLHPLLFQSEPAPTGLEGVAVPVLLDASTNQAVTGNDGDPLRYFSHLPRWVEHDVSGMLIELWLRLDPRVEMRDIVNRINPLPGKTASKTNTYTMRADRFRESIGVPPFRSSRQNPRAFEVAVINNQSREQVLLNTYMRIDLHTQRMYKPVLNDRGFFIGHVDSNLPLDYFLRGFATPIPLPADRLQVILALRHRLQALAIHLNLGNLPQSYETLPADLQPTWFHKGIESENAPPIHQIDGLTHNQWIAELVKQYPGAAHHRSPVRTTPARQPAPTALTAAAVTPTAHLALTGSAATLDQYTFTQPAQTLAPTQNNYTFTQTSQAPVQFPTAYSALTGTTAAPLPATFPRARVQNTYAFDQTPHASALLPTAYPAQTATSATSRQNTFLQGAVQNTRTLIHNSHAPAPFQSTGHQIQSAATAPVHTSYQTQPADIPVFVMPAGDAPPVEPVSIENDMGGYSHYVEVEHQAFLTQEAARRNQDIAQETARRIQEEQDIQEAIQEAMRNYGPHSPYDF